MRYDPRSYWCPHCDTEIFNEDSHSVMEDSALCRNCGRYFGNEDAHEWVFCPMCGEESLDSACPDDGVAPWEHAEDEALAAGDDAYDAWKDEQGPP